MKLQEIPKTYNGIGYVEGRMENTKLHIVPWDGDYILAHVPFELFKQYVDGKLKPQYGKEKAK